MATLPLEAASDPALVRELLSSGANCLRINCAQGDEAVWAAMISNVRQAEAGLGKPCRVMMDLSGPRVRTGGLAPGPEVLKVQPQKDDLGRVVRPARLWLHPEEEHEKDGPAGADARLPLPAAFVSTLREGMTLVFEDTRGASRTMTVTSRDGTGRLVELGKTAYFGSGISPLHPRRSVGLRERHRRNRAARQVAADRAVSASSGR